MLRILSEWVTEKRMLFPSQMANTKGGSTGALGAKGKFNIGYLE